MFKKFFSHHDIYLTGLVFVLLFTGLVTLYSTTRGTGVENEFLFIKQLVFVGIGLVIYFIISFIDLSFLKQKWVNIILYIALSIALISVLLFTAKVKGATRWFVVNLPLVGSINIQPADIAKIVVILIGAYILTQWKLLTKKSNFIAKYPLPVYLCVLLPILILILIQPALGTTIIVTLCLVFMYFYSSSNKIAVLIYFSLFFQIGFVWIIFAKLTFVLKILISLILPAIIFFIFSKKMKQVTYIFFLALAMGFVIFLSQPNSINVLGDYQKDRVNCWLNPELDPTGICFQQIQARIAIGSGEVFGRGFSQGLQVQRESLPEFQNDFIYAAFAEQYGFLGTLVLMALFLLFLIEIFRISNKQRSEYSRIIILGIGIMFLFQIFINISMNNGLLPTTGLSLPFMSYGGTFIIVSLIAVGIIQNLSHNKVMVDADSLKYQRWDED